MKTLLVKIMKTLAALREVKENTRWNQDIRNDCTSLLSWSLCSVRHVHYIIYEECRKLYNFVEENMTRAYSS